MNGQSFETLRLEHRDWLATVTLARPDRLNTLTPTLIGEVGQACRRAVADGVKVLVITGDERAFSAGADLSVVSDLGRLADFHAWNASIHHEFAGIEALGAVTIAAIDGFCLGGGLELAMRCDFRLASPGARVGLPEIHHGLLPTGGGLSTLVDLIGLREAKRLVLSGTLLDVDSALRVGLVDELVAGPAVAAAVQWAEQFSGLPRLALAAAKRAFRLTRTGTPPGWSEELEILTAAMLVASEDGQEGVQAFLAKRQATFL